MLPSARCALTAPFHPYQHAAGGLFSVALSVGSRPPGVTWHFALWSPDFPLPLRRVTATIRPTHHFQYSLPDGTKPPSGDEVPGFSLPTYDVGRDHPSNLSRWSTCAVQCQARPSRLDDGVVAIRGHSPRHATPFHLPGAGGNRAFPVFEFREAGWVLRKESGNSVRGTAFTAPGASAEEFRDLHRLRLF